MLRITLLLLLLGGASCGRWSAPAGLSSVVGLRRESVSFQRAKALTAVELARVRGGESRRKKSGSKSKKSVRKLDEAEEEESFLDDDLVGDGDVEAAKRSSRSRRKKSGGEKDKEEEKGAEEAGEGEEEELEEDLGDEDAESELGVDEDAGIVQRGWAFLRKTPLMTRGYLLASVFSTMISAVFCRNQWPAVLDLKWVPTLKGLQLWRLLTPFLYLGPLNIFWLFNLNVCWTQMATLEKLMYKNPENFLIMLVFGCASLLGIYGLTSLSPKMLGINLMVYTTYVWARCFEGQQINVMDVFIVPAELLPWFFVAQTWVQEGEFPITDLMGIAVGHLYLVLRQNNMLEAPSFVRQLFQSPTMRRHYRRLGQDFAR